MNENKTDQKVEFRGGQFAALIPFIIFIVITITLSFMRAANLNMMIAAGLIGLMVGMFFAKKPSKYWEVILEGLGSKVGMTAVLIWLIVGIFGGILKTGHIVEGLVWLSSILGVRGAAFTVITFVASAIFAVSTGTGFGTIATMGFIMYPAGLLMGANPIYLAGAILSGAAFGDNMAPVSDTTIISATSQLYTKKDGTADIGGVVRTRAKYAIIAGIISIILYAIVGGTSSPTVATIEANEILSSYTYPLGLLLLIPTAIVIFLAIKGKGIFISLTIGIFTAIIIGISAGLFNFSDLVRLENGNVLGAIPDGIGGMTTVSILLMVVVAMGQLLVKSGTMESTVDWLNNRVIKTPRGADLSIFTLTTVFSILIAAINTIAIICAAPFVNAIGSKNHIHPYRRANLLDAASCSFPFFVPYGGCVLLLIGTMQTVSTTYSFVTPLDPFSLFFSVFYGWMIWIVMLIASVSGWGREFEGKDGERVVSTNGNKVPNEAL